MSDLPVMSRDFLQEFVELYKSLPCLWKVKSPDYSNKFQKKLAYEILVDKCKQVEPTSNRETVIRRINSLRACYRKERRKVASSLKLGDENKIYKPLLWYFDLFQFLDEQEAPKSNESNSDCIADQEVAEMQDNDEDFFPPPTVHLETYSPPKKKLKKAESGGDMADAVLDLVVQSLQQSEDGPIDIFGKYVASRLTELPDNMIILAQKVINYTLYEAKMGHLNETSHITHSNSPDSLSDQTNQSEEKLMSALSSLQNCDSRFSEAEYSSNSNPLAYDSETPIDEENLILKVKQFPVIYDAKLKNSRDSSSLKEKLWRHISLQLNCSVSTCQGKWEALEKSFWKAHQLALSAQKNRTKLKQWKWYNAMSYLLWFNDDRPEMDADKLCTSNSNTFSNSSKDAGPRGKMSGVENQSSLSVADEDEAFFISVLPTVRKFDHDDKIDFRGDVLDSVRRIKRSRKSSVPHTFSSRNDEQVFIQRRSVLQNDQLINNLQDTNYVNIKEEEGVYIADA